MCLCAADHTTNMEHSGSWHTTKSPVHVFKMLYLIGPDGLVNRGFIFPTNGTDDNGTCP